MPDLDVLILGPYPPPFGGVSAHVDRVAHAVRTRGLAVGVANHFPDRRRDGLIVADLRRNPLRYWLVLRRAEARIVHYHHSRWSTLVSTALALRHRTAPTVATVHGRELEPYLGSRVPGVARLTRRALRTFDVLIAVSAEIERSLQRIGPPVEMIPAYIPAGDNQGRLSPRTEAFLRGGTNLLVAAYRLTVDRHGRTIYGLETAIQSFAQVAGVRPDLRLAIFLANDPRSHRESERLRSLIEDGTDENVRRRIAVCRGEPLTPAFPLTAVYLRPTLTDGDAVSIREAVAAGVPVLASDVVGRPAGVRTLGPNVSDWSEAILQSLAPRKRASPGAAAEDPLAELLSIYDRLGRPTVRPTEHAHA
jgi:glycogen synthase